MRLLAVLTALLAIAPAAAPAQRSDCKPTRQPKELPAASVVVDSAAALGDLAAIEAPDGMMFTLLFREGDSLPRVRPLFETPITAAAILLARIRPQKPAPLWGIRVRVAQGPPASLQLERAIYCPPVLISETLSPGPAQVRVQRADQPRVNAMGVGRIETETRVSENGEAVSVNLLQASGVRELDDDVVQRWSRARFHPALLDGMRVPGTYRPQGKSPRL
jgi:hypothetical protein